MDMREDMKDRDMRYMADSRNSYDQQAGYMMNARGERRGRSNRSRSNRGGRGGDRGMMYPAPPMYDMRRDMNYGAYPINEDFRGNRMNDMARGDRGSYDMRGMDGHYPMRGGQSMGGQTYYPIEAMGRFNGYWGMPEQDFAMGGRDYGYNDYGDYGETLSEEELEHWNKKLMQKIEDKYKPFFTKENIAQRAKQKGYQMKEFGENELYTATLMQYTDLCKELKPFVGENLDAYIAAGYGFLVDDDTEVKGAEKLSVYYDEIVGQKD